MKRNNILVRCGSMVLAAAVLVTGAWYTERQTGEVSIPQVVEYIDTEDGSIVIPQEEVPLATKPVVKTTKSTKRTVKKEKLKKKATKTATTTTRNKKTRTVNKENAKQKVTTNTTVQTTVVSATKKSSNIKTVTTTVDTTVKTTTTTKPQTTTTAKAATASSSKTQTVTTANVRTLAPKANAVIINAFEKLGFKITVNPTVGYSGYFSVQSHSITLKSSSGDTTYHELGHFVGWLAGNADTSAEFKAIYNKEKGALKSANAKYLTQNSSEYFAESYKEYVLSPQNLKSTRPQTYAFVQKAVNTASKQNLTSIKTAYTKGGIWS